MKTSRVIVFLLMGMQALSQPQATPFSITETDKVKILKTLKQRVQQEDRDFEAREKTAHRDLVRSQNDRRKDRREKERRARRAFFESHGSGPERRAYIQDLIKRNKESDFQEKLEWTEFRKRQKELKDALDSAHREWSQKVNEALARNQRPEGF